MTGKINNFSELPFHKLKPRKTALLSTDKCLERQCGNNVFLKRLLDIRQTTKVLKRHFETLCDHPDERFHGHFIVKDGVSIHVSGTCLAEVKEALQATTATLQFLRSKEQHEKPFNILVKTIVFGGRNERCTEADPKRFGNHTHSEEEWNPA
jgi:hypothetical protein